MPGYDVLIGELRDPDNNVRCRAALQLGTIGDPRAVDALIQSLCTESDVFVREHVTRSLVCLRDAALPPLLDLLGHADPAVRVHAAHALGKLGDVRAVERLVDGLADQDTAVVTKAALALGQVADARAIAPLVRLLGCDSLELRATLVSALERFGASAVPSLIEALGDSTWRSREQAAYLLGFAGSLDAVPALASALADPQWEVRFAVVHALLDLGGEAAALALESMADDPDPRLQQLLARGRTRLRAVRRSTPGGRPPSN